MGEIGTVTASIYIDIVTIRGQEEQSPPVFILILYRYEDREDGRDAPVLCLDSGR